MLLPVGVAQFRPAKAAPATTLDRVGELFVRVASLPRRPRVLLFPESALTGYFLEGAVEELALPAGELFDALARRWHAAAGSAAPLEVGFGFYERKAEGLHNAALYAELGGASPGILAVHRKVFLPTYGVFQESRFVEAGADFRAFDTAWGRAGLLICEDAWHSLSGTLLALDGARVIFVLCASPAHGTRPGPEVPGSLARWDRLLRGIAEEHGVFVVASQLVGFEGGKGFPGGSSVYDPHGRRLARAGLWEEALLEAPLALEEVRTARDRSPLLADLREALPGLLRGGPPPGLGAERGAWACGESEGGKTPERPAAGAGTGDGPAGVEVDEVGEQASGRAGGRHRAEDGVLPDPANGALPDPEDPSPLEIDPVLVEAWLRRFLLEEIRLRRGFDRAVLGLSGGVDSAVAALLCARALGPENVHAFLLPDRVTGEESLRLAREVADTAGIGTRSIPVTEAVDAYLSSHEPEADARRRGNVAARQRMIVLFDQAAALGALPVGTGNKSERLLGYFTWHGDDAAPVNPLGDLFKVQVLALARHLGVPRAVVERPATAELEEGQTDETDLGIGYAEVDLILHHLLEGRRPGRLVDGGFDAEKVRIVLERLEGSHFKRHLPTVAMLSRTAVGEGYLRPVDLPGLERR